MTDVWVIIPQPAAAAFKTERRDVFVSFMGLDTMRISVGVAVGEEDREDRHGGKQSLPKAPPAVVTTILQSHNRETKERPAGLPPNAVCSGWKRSSRR